MTPLHLKIGLHYHVSPEPWPHLDVPLHRDYARHLVNAGLLTELPYRKPEQPEFTKTDGLAVWVGALCETPLPELRWVMPSPATRAETNQREDARG